MNQPSTQPKTSLSEREALHRRLANLQPGHGTRSLLMTGSDFLAIRAEFERLALPVRQALLGSLLEWSEDARSDARWLRGTCVELSAIGYGMSGCAVKEMGIEDPLARELVAIAFFYAGEAAKWGVSITNASALEFRKLHMLVRLAMKSGQARIPMSLDVNGRPADCTLESLYFRALLLARCASGALNARHMEIVDAWVWRWMPALSGVKSAPAGASLRADLDSMRGLVRGPREDEGPSLYLPQEPLEAVFRAIVAEFHAGRVVPSEGIAAGFGLDEYVTVLDLLRYSLDQARRMPAPRAVRHGSTGTVELHVGLGELAGRAFAPPPPRASPVSLAAVEGKSTEPRRVREQDVAFDEIYGFGRRTLRLFDESEGGFGLEGSATSLLPVAVGDIVAVRSPGSDEPVLGKVVRRVASGSRAEVFLGVHRLAGSAHLIDARWEPSSGEAEDLPMVFVRGEDSGGRHDACLVCERTFAERGRIIVKANGKRYALRLNRIRDHGRGWVLAGFEVAAQLGGVAWKQGDRVKVDAVA